MTTNRYGWLHQPSSPIRAYPRTSLEASSGRKSQHDQTVLGRAVSPVGLRRNLSTLSTDACTVQQTVQQGVVEMNSTRAVAARIVPLDDQGEPGPESQVELNSCDGRGISFHHQLPLSTRRALISVEDEVFGRLEAEVSLSWCRFNRMGHYTSGGRFVQPAGKIA